MGEYVVCNDELYHHGTKGMKWGIRRSVSYTHLTLPTTPYV